MRNRRKFTATFKSQVVLQVLSGERTVAEICREYGLSGQMVNEWTAQFVAGVAQVFEAGAAGSEEQGRSAMGDPVCDFTIWKAPINA